MSIHHQAVGKVGADFQVCAHSMDGKIVEAICSNKYANVVGLQFHPEAGPLWDPKAKGYADPYEQVTSPPNVGYAAIHGDAASANLARGIWGWLSEKVNQSAKSA